MFFKKKTNHGSPIDDLVVGRFRLRFAAITSILIFILYMMATPQVMAQQDISYFAMLIVSIFAAQIAFFVGHLFSRLVRRDRILERARAAGQYFTFG